MIASRRRPKTRREDDASGAAGRAPAGQAEPVCTPAIILARVGTLKEAMRTRGESAPAFVYHGIINGYRLHNLTFWESLRSLFEWHNETMNVWTHLFGFCLFVWLLISTVMMAGVARLPEPLVECAHSHERVSCLRALALGSLSDGELARISSGIAAIPAAAAATNIPFGALGKLVDDTARALNGGAKGANQLRRRAVRHLAAVRVPLPRWITHFGRPEPEGPVEPVEPELPPAAAAASGLPGRLGQLVAGLGGLALPQLRQLMDATASGMHATADSIGQRLNRTVDAVHRGEALLLDVAVDVSSHVSRLLQLSALIASLPELPELADLRSEANSVLGAFSDALHLPHLEAVAAPALERWPIFIFLGSAMMCLMGSAIYHLFGTANAAWAKVLGTFDFIGITALIVGSFVPILYYGFYEQRLYRSAYIGAMCALGSVVFVLALTPLFHDERYRKLRTGLFTGLGASGVVPITHMLFHIDSHLASMIIFGTSATGVSYLCGTLFYLTRFPEVARPGKFDLVFSSHNIWHVMVVIAASVHYAFVLKLWHETSSMLAVRAGPGANGTGG